MTSVVGSRAASISNRGDERLRARLGPLRLERQDRRVETARGHRPAEVVKQRQLAERREREHAVAQDAFLLLSRERGVLEVGGHFLEQLEVVRHVGADLLGRALGGGAGFRGDRLPRARPQQLHRDDAVGEERRHGGGRHERDEARPERAHGEVARQSATLLMMSRSSSRGISKRRLIARLTSLQ